MTAETIALLLAASFGIGLCFAIAFVFALMPRYDSAARGASLGFRLLALPGAFLCWPRTAAIGAALSLGIISGAIVSHIATLGITIPAVDDQSLQSSLFSPAQPCCYCIAASCRL
ncbi:MAG: hypothetical protein FJW38_14295 [Acidobacteria bacterium]|nr:hypothetical protein [Acidobacteriota bacterium]